MSEDYFDGRVEAETIIAFVRHIVPEAPTKTHLVAVERGWLDAGGQVTSAGRQLIRELTGQNGTRTVFRQLL